MNPSTLTFNPRLVDEFFENPPAEMMWTSAGPLPTEELPRSGRKAFLTNTMLVMERLSGQPNYIEPIPGDRVAPYGRFRTRHIIGTGTRVLGGVYLGHRPREALVVTADSPTLNRLVLSFFERRFSLIRKKYLLGEIDFECTPEQLRRVFTQDLHEQLFVFVRECLPYDEPQTSKVFKTAKIPLDAELSLDVYVEAKTGVCRQQVLLLLALFELLERMKLTEGRMLISRCYIPNMFSHAWARYERPDQPTYILDPAQNFCGRLDHGGEMGKFVYDHEFAKILNAA